MSLSMRTLAVGPSRVTTFGWVVLAVWLAGNSAANADQSAPDKLVGDIANAIGKRPDVTRVSTQAPSDLIRKTVEIREDKTYPIKVDIVAHTKVRADHVLYMLPGGGVNFESSFLTPLDDSLAKFLAERGALIVGITPPEDAVPADLKDYSFMKEWGLAKHRNDVRTVVKLVQSVVHLPYDVLGHSYGAAIALDYAGRNSDVRKLIVLDIYSLDPKSDLIPQAERTYQAHVQLIAGGVYHDDSYSGLKAGVLAASADPSGDSGVSREDVGKPGNFTLEGLLYFSFINNALLPGIHTPITGLPGDWLLQQSILAGDYELADDPADDSYSFARTSIDTVREAAALVGGGVLPVALERDYWAVTADNPAYKIRWNDIKAEVLWLNTELGYDGHTDAATRIRRGGNDKVTVDIVRGYGHADIIWGDNARRDVWRRLVKSK